MNARVFTTATLAFVCAGVLPAKAADPQLVALVMPDAQVLAGVNVEQAKATPFGQYVLSQVQSNDPKLQQLINLTGFNPTTDVREVLVASNGATTNHSGMVLARGTFDPAKIAAAATNGGGTTEKYKDVTIIEDPQKSHGVAFLDSTLVVAGDLANVKAAIDRQTKAAASISATLAVQVNQWSGSQDAWVVSTVPVSALHPPANAPTNVPGLNNALGSFQGIQQAAAGVKFGTIVVVSAQVQADTAQNAKTIGDTLKLLANLAQMQASQNQAAAAASVALAQSLTVSTNGNILTASVSLSQDQLQQVINQEHKQAHRPQAKGRQ